MKLFIDTADPEQVRLAHGWGIIDGVTTNPSHVAKTGRPGAGSCTRRSWTSSTAR